MDVLESFSTRIFHNVGDDYVLGPFMTYQEAVEMGMDEASRFEEVISFAVDKVFKVNR